MNLAGLKVFVGCECSGMVRDAFLRRGASAVSCDLKNDETSSGHHIVGDVLEVMGSMDRIDLAILHPECRFLCSSGLHWNSRRPERRMKTESAFRFVMELRHIALEKADHWGIENSVGILSTRWRKPNQIVQPYQFGEDASKATAFWTHNLPDLNGTDFVSPRWVCQRCGRTVRGVAVSQQTKAIDCRACRGKMLPRWSNQTDSGQNKLAPSTTRSADRARTFPGIADAMAEQWGTYVAERHGNDLIDECS